MTKKYPFYTPYQFAGNSPVLYVDIDGLEPDWLKNQAELISSGPSKVNSELNLQQEWVPYEADYKESMSDDSKGGRGGI